MPSLSHEDTLWLYLSLALILFVARVLGEILRKLGQPPVMGELLAGVLLGATCLGTLAPKTYYQLFLRPQAGMALSGVTSFCVTMYMLVAGMELDLKSAIKERKATILVELLAVIVPFVTGFLLAYYVPEYMGNTHALNQKNYALFTGTAMSITALPVIAKTLRDLNLFKSRMGIIVVSSAVADDVVGWSLFAVVLALATESEGGGENGLGVGGSVAVSFIYVIFMFTIGRWTVHRSFPFIQTYFSYPAGELGFVCLLTLASCCFALWIGLHNTLGAFLVGAAVGDTPHFRHEMREHLDNFVTYMVSPLFFGSICLNANFIKDFDYKCVLLVLAGSCFGKLIGSVLGAKLASLSWRDALAIAVCMNARGAMELILANVAMTAGIIDGKMFVSLVFMAIVTSVIPGPLLRRIIKQPTYTTLSEYVHSNGFVQLSAASFPEVISSLCKAIGHEDWTAQVLTDGIVVRHEAVIHHLKGAAAIRAVIPELKKPTVAVGVLPGTLGVCGLPTKFFLLLLMPKTTNQEDLGLWDEVRIFLQSQKFCKELAIAKNRLEMLALMQIERYRGGLQEGSTSSEEMPISASIVETAEIDEAKCLMEVEQSNFDRLIDEGCHPVDARMFSRSASKSFVEAGLLKSQDLTSIVGQLQDIDLANKMTSEKVICL